MDRLHAYILILHAKVKRDGIPRSYLKRTKSMTPKVQGLAAAMAKLHHGLDDRAGKLLARIESVDQRGDVAFKKAHATLDAGEASLKDVEQFVDDLEKTNGGPTLDDSATGSEPHKSWTGSGQDH